MNNKVTNEENLTFTSNLYQEILKNKNKKIKNFNFIEGIRRNNNFTLPTTILIDFKKENNIIKHIVMKVINHYELKIAK